MKKLVAIGFIALLAACPSKTKTDNPDPVPAKAYDAAPAASDDAGIWHPIVRDKRISVKTEPANKKIDRPSSTVVWAQPTKIVNGTIGLGLIAVVKRGGKLLKPPIIYLKFIGMHGRDSSLDMTQGNRWMGCYDHTLIPDGKAIAIAEDKMSGGSSGSGGNFQLEHIDLELTLTQLGAIAYAKQLKAQLCKDAITFKPDEQTIIKAMYSELRSPTLFK